jgi:hypothetical protein
VDKLANWCKDAQGVSEAAYKVATADQAMCYGATPTTFTWNQNGPNTGAPNGFPTLGYGKDQSCDWQANDTIKVAVQVTAQHWGTHYIDMIPQNKKQVDDLPKCEFTKNRIKDFKPCVQPNVIPENTIMVISKNGRGVRFVSTLLLQCIGPRRKLLKIPPTT